MERILYLKSLEKHKPVLSQKILLIKVKENSNKPSMRSVGSIEVIIYKENEIENCKNFYWCDYEIYKQSRERNKEFYNKLN